jgi:hypothetical protein
MVKSFKKRSIRKHKKTQKLWKMKGCSSRKRQSNSRKLRGGSCGCGNYLGGAKKAFLCKKCGPNCRCGPKCDCGHNCPGNCYLRGQRGGCGCDNIMNGGCGQCTSWMKGGSPAPFVGAPYAQGNLPGEQGVAGVSNYYDNNKYLLDPQYDGVTSERYLTGGRRHSRKRRGGGLLPQDLVNAGRNVMFGLGSTYNALNGYPAPVNPLPYNQNQLLSSNI